MSFCLGGVKDNCPNYPSGEGALNLFLTLVNSLYAAKCSFDYTDKYPDDYGPYLKDEQEFDFIIVGGGTAGSVVGNVLTENPDWNILVLEAGNIPSTTSEIPSINFKLFGTEEDYQYKIQPNKNALLSFKDQQNYWNRGKFLGGTSSMNHQHYLRGQDITYEEWAALGNTGWDYKSVLPYFLMNENMTSDTLKDSYGTTGFQKLLHDRRTDDPIADVLYEAVEEIGVEALTQEGTGFWEGVGTNYGGERWNAGKSFLGLVKDRQNLYVSYGSFVERILITDGKATGVLVNVQGRKITVKADKEVIVSAGVVNSPQLLMLSGIGPKEDLEKLQIKVVKDLPVGRNIEDHVVYSELLVKMTKWEYEYPNSIDDIYNYFMYRNSTRLARGAHKLLLSLTPPDSKKIKWLFFVATRPKGSIDQIFSAGTDIDVDEVIDYTIQINKMYPLSTFIFFYLNPLSRGSIVLNTTNPYDAPLIFFEYLQFEQELNEMLQPIRFVENLIQTEPFKKLGAEAAYIPIGNCPGLEPGSDAYWKCAFRNYASSGCHPSGSCRMGVDNNSVVDTRLKVYGINGLRVIDSSVMPTSPTGPIMGPTLMIGQKGGRMIKEDWKIA